MNIHARVDSVADDSSDTPSYDQLVFMDDIELRQLASSLNIDMIDRLRREELIATIKSRL